VGDGKKKKSKKRNLGKRMGTMPKSAGKKVGQERGNGEKRKEREVRGKLPTTLVRNNTSSTGIGAGTKTP